LFGGAGLNNLARPKKRGQVTVLAGGMARIVSLGIGVREDAI